MNTGRIMSDETFITHLLNSLPQTVYEGAILVIKDKLRRSILEITEIEQILEDKFQSMMHAKEWEEEEDDYALFVSPSNKKGPKKAFKGHCGYCGEFGHKAADCPNKKSNQNKAQKPKNQQKKRQWSKGDSKGKGHIDMSKIKCYNCGEFGHFARDKKVSKIASQNPCWIWTILVYVRSVRWSVQNHSTKTQVKTK